MIIKDVSKELYGVVETIEHLRWHTGNAYDDISDQNSKCAINLDQSMDVLKALRGRMENVSDLLDRVNNGADSGVLLEQLNGGDVQDSEELIRLYDEAQRDLDDGDALANIRYLSIATHEFLDRVEKLNQLVRD